MTQKTYGWNTVKEKISLEAVKHGCTNPEKLIRLMDDSDLEAIQIGENFSVDMESVRKVVEKNKEENSFLFKSATPMPANGTPSNKVVQKDKTEEEIYAAYLESLK